MAVPYYKPVAPEVPVADNTAAKIIASADLTGSMFRGLATYAQINAQKQHHELSLQKMAQDIHESDRMFALKQQSLDQDAELQPLRIELLTEQANAAKALATHRLNAGKTAAQEIMEVTRQQAQVRQEAGSRAKELKLDDPMFQTKSPVEFAANLQKFEDEYSAAPPTTGIPQTMKRWRTIADQQKIELPIGANGTKRKIPYWQVVRDLKDPAMTDAMQAALGEHLKSFKGTVERQDPKFGGMGTVKENTRTPDEIIRPWLEEGKSVDFTRSANRVPLFGPRSQKAAVADSQIAPLPQPEGVDQVRLVRQRENALKTGRWTVEQINESYLKQGGDPSLLK